MSLYLLWHSFKDQWVCIPYGATLGNGATLGRSMGLYPLWHCIALYWIGLVIEHA
jgi:hypothetical protein